MNGGEKTSGRMHKIGAVFFALWGVFHIGISVFALIAVIGGGGAAFLELLGAESPPLLAISSAVMAQHLWNLTWIGALVLFVAIKYNWRNSREGYWLNLTVASAAELGSVVALIAPGHIPLLENLGAPIIWALAVIFATIGFLREPTT